MKPLDTSTALTTERVKIIERIIGKFLYCATRLDNTCLVPLITMSTKHYPTEQDEKYVHQFLDYMTTHPNSVVRFHASDMILRANTDESYMTEMEAHNCAEVLLLLGSIPSKCVWEQLNGPIYVNDKILKVVADSAVEA